MKARRKKRRRDPAQSRAQSRVLLELWGDVLRVRESWWRQGKLVGHNIYYRTENNPRGESLAHHRTIVPDKENIEAAYVLSDALMERGGRLAKLGEDLIWFMNVFEESIGSREENVRGDPLDASEWADFGFLIGDLTRELTGFAA